MQILNYHKGWIGRPIYPPIFLLLFLLCTSLFAGNSPTHFNENEVVTPCSKGIALPFYEGTVIGNNETRLLCQEEVSGLLTDFEFQMVQVVDFDSLNAGLATPRNYFIQYEIQPATVVDPNTPAVLTTTLSSLAAPFPLTGGINTVFEPMVQDAYMISSPADFTMPAMVSYHIIVRLMESTGAGDVEICDYVHRFKITLNPTPEVQAVFGASVPTGTSSFCGQESVSLQTNIISSNAPKRSFSWAVVAADPGFGGSFDNQFAQNPNFIGTVDNAVTNGQTGNVTVEVTYENEDGCVSTDQLNIELVKSIGALSCNDQVNISLDDDCEVTIHPDQVLEGSFGGYDRFQVVIYDGGTIIGNTVNGSHINRNLTVRVIDQCSQNYCWGFLKVEDKLAPVLDCSINSYKTNAATGHIGIGDDRYQPTIPFAQGTASTLCLPSGAATNAYYETLEFTTTTFGNYIFEMVSNSTDFDGALYAGSFDPANPCINLLVADEASSSIAGNPKLDVTLPIGTYVLVTYGHTDTDMGHYQWEITSPTDVNGIPQSICTMTDTITIGCTIDLSTIPGPSAVDACEGNITPQLLSLTTDNFGCGRADGTVEIITRTYRATDSHGNVSNTCQQVIKYVRKTLNAVTFPPNYDDITLPSLDCSLDMIEASPDSIGYPKVDGGSILIGNACMLNVGYEDNVLQTCGTGKKILRKWTVLDWCAPLVTGVNPLEHTQIIKFEDKTPPQITCVDDIEVSAENSNCTADVTFPAIQATDDCSGVTVTINTPYGAVNANGGTINGFPIGTYNIDYVVRDSCGNDTTCTAELKIIDKTEPTPICIEFLTTSLTSTGTATVPATSFDAGSSDNCCLDRFEVRRVTQRVRDFSPSVTFDCTDVGDTVMVVLRVYDCYDNFNECMVGVRVDDKLGSSLSCPPNIVINCTDDIFDLTLTGVPTVVNGCSSSTPAYRDFGGLDRCGVGEFRRRFEITTNGTRKTCDQTIGVRNSNPFDPNTIDWPNDRTFIDDCGKGLHPDSLSAPFSYPTYSQDFCADLFLGYEDEYFERVQGACFKIFRNWKLIDWCTYDPDDPLTDGVWTHRQTLVVMDSRGPEMTCVPNIIVDADANCVGSFEIDEPTNVTDCSPDISFEVTGDFDRFGTINDVAPGTYFVEIFAKDGCGNANSCVVPIVVRDVKAPSAACIDLIVDLNPTWAMAQVKAWMLGKNNIDNCGGAVNYSFSVNMDDTCKNFTCVDTGVNIVNLYVWDEFGNNDFCSTTVTVQDNFSACDSSNSKPIIVGNIKNDKNEPVQNVEVSINGIDLASVMTKADGAFEFAELQAGEDYTIYPICNENYRNGVSTFDIIQISKHILNERPLDSPYKLIAADANRSGSVTTLDIVAVQKLILHISNDFPNNTSWRFVHRDYAFPLSDNPWYETFPELSSVNDISGINQVDFTAIKIGDVNGDADMANSNFVDFRTFEEHLNFLVSNQKFEKGKQVEVEFTSDNFDEILGYQSTIHFDEKVLELADIISGNAISEKDFGMTFLDKGILTTSWHSPAEKSFDSGEVLFTLVFNTKEIGEVASSIWMDGSLTTAEAYQKDGNPLGVKLELNDALEDAEVQLFQNEPNPFSNQTVIKFFLPKASEAIITITDVSGKVVRTIKNRYEAGMNQEILNKGDLPSQSVFYYRMQTEDFIGVKKMLLIE